MSSNQHNLHVPHHPPSASLNTTPSTPSYHSQSPARSFDQSKSRGSTRQSNLSSSLSSSNWTSVSGVSKPESKSSAPVRPVRPYFYPTSGYPVSKSVLQGAYPGSGYPVSELQHSYGYPCTTFPGGNMPGVADLTSTLQYPGSEFPMGGEFPGEFDQDDGSAPFIGTMEQDPLSPGGFLGASGGYPGGSLSSLPVSDTMYMPGAFHPQYDGTYPV